IRTVNEEIAALQLTAEEDLPKLAEEMRVPVALVRETRERGRLPVVNFAAGGVAIPADAALMMQLGCDGVFVGSGIFKSEEPAVLAKAIVEAVAHYQDPAVLAKVSRGLGQTMRGISVAGLASENRLAERGW